MKHLKEGDFAERRKSAAAAKELLLEKLRKAPKPDDPEVADLGFRLLRRHWHKGLASERARKLVRHGFADLGLDRIIAQTMAVNTSSRAVLERVGLTYVRTFPTSMTEPVEGVDEGEVEYELTTYCVDSTT